jgi:hypothetical protein
MLAQSEVEEGAMPQYDGETPEAPEVGFVTGRGAPFEYVYVGDPIVARVYEKGEFEGWSPAISKAAREATYTAKYTKGKQLEFPENYSEGGNPLVVVMQRIPYKIILNNGIHAIFSRTQVKAKMGYGPGNTPTEYIFYKNGTSFSGMIQEGSRQGLDGNGNFQDSHWTSFDGPGIIHVEGQPLGYFYVPASYMDYHPDDYKEKMYYTQQLIPSKATTPVINGRVLNITETKGLNYMDGDDPTPIVYARVVTIDTNNDGKEDERMTLSPLYIAHKEIFHQIAKGDDISFHIHQYADRIGDDSYGSSGAGKVSDGRVFPEDVESYGNYINDRDFIYKWATGNPDANSDNFNDIELGGQQSVPGYEGYRVVYGTPYTGKASSLK